MTLPPYSPDAEDHVVAAAIASPRALATISETIAAGAIYQLPHARILQAALTMHDAGEPVDLATLGERIEARDERPMLELASMTVTTSNVHHHVRIVNDYHTRRRLIDVGQTIARSGWEPEQPIGEELARAEQLVYQLATDQDAGELHPIRDTLPATFELLDRPGGEITGTPTGLRELDTITAGLQPGNLVVVAARPGLGKSALALNACHHCAVALDRPAALFTLEMSAQEINQRLLAVDGRVPLMKIRTRNGLTGDDRAALVRSGGRLDRAPLYVDDTASIRVIDIRARARRLKQRQPGLAVVVVDYLQLMITDSREETRNLEVSRISRGLKLLARELDVPVMAIAQLNRNVEHRHDKKPMLSDLRDSGAIEQDADVVIFIHRDPDDDQAAELTVAKHRNGPTGPARVAWVKKHATFANLAPEQT